MGNKATGKNYTSKGEHANVSSSVLSSIRRDDAAAKRVMNCQKAWLGGQNPWVAVKNTNPNETNKPFVRMRANDIWGNPKNKKYWAAGGA